MKTSDFFDAQHDDDLLPLPVHYRLLRRFEVTRDEVASSLLTGGESLLDVGCGAGQVVKSVANRFNRVVAADIAPRIIRDTARRCGPIASWTVLDASRPLPFADETFSNVVALSMLQYIFSPESLLREVHRVLRPRGEILVETPNIAYFPQRLRLLAGRPIRTSFWKHGIDGGNLHYFTVDTLRTLVTEAGFLPTRITGSGILAQIRTWRVNLLCGNIFVLAVKRS